MTSLLLGHGKLPAAHQRNCKRGNGSRAQLVCAPECEVPANSRARLSSFDGDKSPQPESSFQTYAASCRDRSIIRQNLSSDGEYGQGLLLEFAWGQWPSRSSPPEAGRAKATASFERRGSREQRGWMLRWFRSGRWRRRSIPPSCHRDGRIRTGLVP